MCALGGPRRWGPAHRRTGCLWRPGAPATGRAGRGVVCLSGVARGTRGLAAPAAGRTAASGQGASPPVRERRTTHTPGGMLRWAAVIRPLPGQKGGQDHRGPRTPERRTAHDHTRLLRGAGPPARRAPDAGPRERSRRGGGVMARAARTPPGIAGRQRRRGAQTGAGPVGRRRCAGSPPSKETPHSAAGLR
jgi:hypothetical protein